MDLDLDTYIPTAAEEEHFTAIKQLLKTRENAFYRTCFDPGHITASALLLSADGSRVLLNHHKFLNKWLSFGGHADGERDTLSVAMREAREESGIETIVPVMSDILDVDVHPIPENTKKGEPAHHHFDIRYLLRVETPQDEEFVLSDESVDLRWCDYQTAMSLIDTADISMRRLLEKWQSF